MVSVDLNKKIWIDEEEGGDGDIYENCPHVYSTFFIVLSSHYIIVCVHINCTHPVKSTIQQYAAIHYLLDFTPIMPYIKFNSPFLFILSILSILSSSSSHVEKMSPVCRYCHHFTKQKKCKKNLLFSGLLTAVDSYQPSLLSTSIKNITLQIAKYTRSNIKTITNLIMCLLMW